ALLAGGDLLYTRYNGNAELVGACAVVPGDAGALTYPDKLIRAVPDRQRVDPSFLALACTFGAGRQQIRSSVKTTAGQAGISGRDLKSVMIRVPELEIQRRVVSSMAARLEDIA